MSTQANATVDSYSEPRPVAPTAISAAQLFYWAVRRELWENRAIYIAPFAAAAVGLFGFLATLVHLPAKMRAASALASEEHSAVLLQPYDTTAALLMATFLIVAVFYCIEALQKERRDRSILFWKSLPVSDLTTVAAKAFIPLVLLPLLTIALIVAVHFVMLLLGSLALAANGLSVAQYWQQISLFQLSLVLAYHVMTVHVLGCAPVYAWLLLVSAWARRAASLWAVLPPLAIGALETFLFNTSHFGALLLSFLAGNGTAAMVASDGMMNPSTQLTPWRFLLAPSLWIGLAVSVAFLAAAVQLRRHRGPS
jgi:ABC-2 type transport system permease protein